MAEVFKAKIMSAHGFEKLAGHQAHPAQPGRGQELRLDVHRRGEADRPADPPEDRPGDRLRRGEGAVLHRARVHRRLRCPGPAAVGGQQADPAAHAHRMFIAWRCWTRSTTRTTPATTRAGPCASSTATSRPSNVFIARRGRRQAGRLRHRPRPGARVQDPGRHAQGQIRLHVARAGDGQHARRPQRSVRGRASCWPRC